MFSLVVLFEGRDDGAGRVILSDAVASLCKKCERTFLCIQLKIKLKRLKNSHNIMLSHHVYSQNNLPS